MYRTAFPPFPTRNGRVSTLPYTRSDLRIPLPGGTLQHVPGVLVKP